VILVGGGAILVSRDLQSASTVVRPEHSSVANAIGAAVAQVGGEVDRVFAVEGTTRDAVRTLVDAHELLAQRGVTVQTLLAGESDPSNPASIPNHVLNSWRLTPNLQLLGHVEDIRTVWARAHVAILPSRREGLPKSLLEAAACGRPLIATDVPGCREIARNGVNALLIPTDDAEALAQAIETLLKDRDLRVRFGHASRQIVVSEYSSTRIGSEIVALYGRLMDGALSSKLPVRLT
jgi:glycosyltransferase involved in cell wall biosynthesis